MDNTTDSPSPQSAPAACSEVPEAVILDMHHRAYERKDQLVLLRKASAIARSEAERMEAQVTFAEQQLRDIADFLQHHNADANDPGETWHAVLDLPNSPISATSSDNKPSS